MTERKRFFINGEPSAGLPVHVPYLKVADKALDALKDRMAAGGLLQLAQNFTLEDGTAIAVSSRFGQDEIRIDVPRTFPVPVEEKEDEEERKRKKPYLWVGVRVAWERMGLGLSEDADWDKFVWDANALDLVQLQVWEPGLNGIVATSPTCGAKTLYRYYLERPGGTTAYDNEAVRINEAALPDFARSYPDYQFKTEGGLFPRDRFNFFCTKNLLYLSAWGFSPMPVLDNYDWTSPNLRPEFIYDPEGGDDQYQKRPIPTHFTGVAPGEPWPLWDAVAWLDPALGVTDPTDRRDLIDLAAFARDHGLPFDTPQVIPGDYLIKVCGKGRACPPVPVEIDLEVRVLKKPHTKTERYQLTLDALGQECRTVLPYGWRWPEADGTGQGGFCPGTSGPNPHASNYWPGAILANPSRGTITREEYVVPPHGFEPQAFAHCQDFALATWSFRYLIGFTQPVSAPWENYVADVAARLIALHDGWGFPSEYPYDAYLASIGRSPLLSSGFAKEVKDAAQRDIVDHGGIYGLWQFDPAAMAFFRRPVGNLLSDGWTAPLAAEALADHVVLHYWVIGWSEGSFDGSTGNCLDY